MREGAAAVPQCQLQVAMAKQALKAAKAQADCTPEVIQATFASAELGGLAKYFYDFP